MYRANNVEFFATLPAATLPALMELTIWNCTGIENIVFPDLTPARLKLLYLYGKFLDDTSIGDILVSVGSSSSASSLRTLILRDTDMTVIPRIGSFSNLDYYDVGYNSIPSISQSSLIFSSSSIILNLRNNSLGVIEDGAFIGDFEAVFLENNQLTEFREDVFKSMLQQMLAVTGGGVYVAENPFDCGCGLAWLIRDNRAFIPNVIGGVCGGFFKFEDLNPESYANC